MIGSFMMLPGFFIFLTLFSITFVNHFTVDLQWTPQTTPVTASLRGLSVVDDQVAWASGAEGTCLRTVDGGTTWEKRSIPDTDSVDFRDIEAFSADEAFVLSAGEPALLYHTTDGGASWQLRYENRTPGIFFDVLTFWDHQHGIAMSDPVDGHFVLIATNNGGQTWQPLSVDHMPPPVAGEAGFAASGTGMATVEDRHVWLATGGAQARVFRSSDRGAHWQVATTPMPQGEPSQGIFSIVFADTLRGVIVGGDYQQPSAAESTASFTDDGGATWHRSKTFPAGYRSAVAYHAGAEILLTVGPTGAECSTDLGHTWYGVLDTVGYHTVRFAPNHEVGWAAGSDGRISKINW